MQSLLEELTRVNGTIDELLFLSRAESRSIALELSPQDPGLLLANFSVDAQVLAEHHQARFSYSHDGTGIVHCEPRWIRRVLLNLLSNAINVSSPGGRITLDSTVSDGTWKVELEDEGPGVPSTEYERIFDRFVRLASTGRPERDGSGLGLAICRSIVELHRGRIYAGATASGHGLRVVFEIPASTSAVDAEAARPSAPVPATSA